MAYFKRNVYPVWLQGLNARLDLQERLNPYATPEEAVVWLRRHGCNPSKKEFYSMFNNYLPNPPHGDVNSAASDDELLERCPILHTFLTSLVDDDGRPRRTATVCFYVEDGGFKACLKERNRDLTLWATAPSLWGALDGLEKAFHDTPVPWRKGTVNGKWKR